MTTILYAHPYDKSFNHAILETVRHTLETQGEEYTVLDLYKDGFSPVLDAPSLALYSQGQTADPLAQKYLEVLTYTDKLVIICPIWWSTMPAIVNGFFDKVMLSGTAFKYSAEGLVPDKIHTRRTLLFTTSEALTEVFAPYFREYFPTHVLATVGLDGYEWHNCPGTSHGDDAHRAEYLAHVADVVAE